MPAAVSPPTATAPSAVSQPESLFDSISDQRIEPVIATVDVHAIADSVDAGSAEPVRVGGQEILTAAGSFGDMLRYMQVFPGVIATSDLSTQMMVRGGHPMENLFLVDGIEVPNISHLANANTTGGFGPMIDAAAVQDLQFYSSAFDVKYPERLSSVTEFETLDSGHQRRHTEFDLGVQGLGGLVERNVGGGDLLLSAHHGLVNLVSQDVGIGGTPSYTNELVRYRKRDESGGGLTILHLGGVDGISVTPCAADAEETSTIDSTYKGWRETTGALWQQVYSAHAFGMLNVSDSEQVEHINESDQLIDPLMPARVKAQCPLPNDFIQTTPVYRENSNNAFSTSKYSFEYGSSRMTVTAGSAFWLQRPQFAVDQPVGAYSPYDPSMQRSDSTSFNSNFAAGESGTYSEMSFRPLTSLSVSAGGRLQTFAFGNHVTLSPRLSAGYQLGERAELHVAYASYAQLPPYAYLVSYPVNHSLSPMRATHYTAGMNLGFIGHSQIRIETYAKDYRAIPASTEYPGVTLHTMVEMLGEQTVWLPMTTAGRGGASGIEVSDRTQIGSRLQLQGSVAYSRAKFAGMDGVMHPSNFDLPWLANAAGVERLGRGFVLSQRYGFASGRPYTPFSMTESLAQNRPIYDLTEINVPRAPYYARLDAQMNKEMRIRAMNLEVYMGVDNILNRSNFLSYAWMPRYEVASACRNPVGTLWQTPIFPNFGVRLIVH